MLRIVNTVIFPIIGYMNEISNLNRALETFCENHEMVNSFHHLSSIEQLDGLGSEYRSVAIIPSTFSIEQDGYTIDYIVVVMDKVRSGDATALVKAEEGNVFVLGQLMDYLASIDSDITIEGGSFASPPESNEDGYNIVASVGTLTNSFSRPLFRNFTF